MQRPGFRFVNGVIALLVSAAALAHDEPEPRLLGVCSAGDLSAEPYAAWYVEGRDGYVPNPAITEALRALPLDDVRVEIFFGTWCGDSRRELPRLVKTLDAIGLGDDRRTIVAVDNADDAIKRSPGGEEAGRAIFRVPTVIVTRGGAEVGRIVEHPVLSLERDLLAILSGDAYSPSYPAYSRVRGWLADGLLDDPNVDPSGLARIVRGEVQGRGDLAAVARVLDSRGESAAARKLQWTNARLFPDDASVWLALAEGLAADGDADGARDAAERALARDPDDEQRERLVAVIARDAPPATEAP